MVEKERDEQINDEEYENKEVVMRGEDKTLIWVLVVVAIVFGAILIPYFIHQSAKTFTYDSIDWQVKDMGQLHIFHGRFLSLTIPNLHYNIFLRTDPRENNVSVSGKLNSYKYGGAISLSPSVDKCRGDLSRVMLDLSAFLKQGVGVGPILSASDNQTIAKRTGRPYITCENTFNRTVVVVRIGKENVAQDSNNHYCYTIYADNCEDSKSVEKFMVRAVKDFRDANPINASR